MTRKRLLQLITVLALIFVVLQGMNAMSKPAAQLGVVDGRLADCPNKPNCVLSQAPKGQHAIAPLTFTSDAAEAWQAIRAVMDSHPRAKLMVDEDSYLRYECRTAIMGYVDDVEFLLDAAHGKIDIRSASRLGYSDMGANRKRMENIRALFAAELAK